MFCLITDEKLFVTYLQTLIEYIMTLLIYTFTYITRVVLHPCILLGELSNNNWIIPIGIRKIVKI